MLYSYLMTYNNKNDATKSTSGDTPISKIFMDMDLKLGKIFYNIKLGHWQVDLLIDLVKDFRTTKPKDYKHSETWFDNLVFNLQHGKEIKS